MAMKKSSPLLAKSRSGLDVVNVRIYCANVAWFGAVNEVYADFFGSDFSTLTFAPVASSPAEIDLEIDCVGYVGARQEGTGWSGDCIPVAPAVGVARLRRTCGPPRSLHSSRQRPG